MKLKLALVSALIAMGSSLNAATFVVSNVGTGYGDADALFQNVDNTLLNGGIVALGYFAAGAPSGDIGQIGTTITNFTLITSALAGTYGASLGAALPGYVEADGFEAGTITGADPRIGLGLYVFAGNAATLEGSNAWALVQVNTIRDDNPFPNTYNAQPFGQVPVIGTVGAFSGVANGFAESTYTTLQLAVIPEPSAALLGVLGALGLLRRRRI